MRSRCHPKVAPPAGDHPGSVGIPESRDFKVLGPSKQCQREHGIHIQRVKKEYAVGVGFAPVRMGKKLLELIGHADIVLSREAVSVKGHCAPSARIEKAGHLRLVQVTQLCFRAACSNHFVRAELIRDLAGGIIGDGVGNRRNNGLVRALKYAGSSPDWVRIEVVERRRNS